MIGRSGVADSGQLYVVGPVWHIVDGPGAAASRLGPVYPFKCFRWMLVRRAEERGLYRGEPPASEPVCGDCLRFGVKQDAPGAVDGAGDEDAF